MIYFMYRLIGALEVVGPFHLWYVSCSLFLFFMIRTRLCWCACACARACARNSGRASWYSISSRFEARREVTDDRTGMEKRYSCHCCPPCIKVLSFLSGAVARMSRPCDVVGCASGPRNLAKGSGEPNVNYHCVPTSEPSRSKW